MENQKVWILEYTVESKIGIYRDYQLTENVEVFATKEEAEMHAKWFVDENVQNGWKVEEDLNGKKLYYDGCFAKGYRILPKEVNNAKAFRKQGCNGKKIDSED